MEGSLSSHPSHEEEPHFSFTASLPHVLWSAAYFYYLRRFSRRRQTDATAALSGVRHGERDLADSLDEAEIQKRKHRLQQLRAEMEKLRQP